MKLTENQIKYLAEVAEEYILDVSTEDKLRLVVTQKGTQLIIDAYEEMKKDKLKEEAERFLDNSCMFDLVGSKAIITDWIVNFYLHKTGELK
jgi:hypothetical protein